MKKPDYTIPLPLHLVTSGLAVLPPTVAKESGPAAPHNVFNVLIKVHHVIPTVPWLFRSIYIGKRAKEVTFKMFNYT